MPFDNSICHSQLSATRSRGLSPLSQQNTLANVGGPLKRKEGTDTAACNRSANTDDSLRYATYVRFDCLHSLNLNYNPFTKVEERPEKCQYVPDR